MVVFIVGYQGQEEVIFGGVGVGVGLFVLGMIKIIDEKSDMVVNDQM